MRRIEYWLMWMLLLLVSLSVGLWGCGDDSEQDNQDKTPLLDMVAIPGGTFSMGDHSEYAPDSQIPVHEVTVSPFSMAKYEVSYGEWKEVKTWAETNGYKFDYSGRPGNKPDYSFDYPHDLLDTSSGSRDFSSCKHLPSSVSGQVETFPVEDNSYPVTYISWYDAIKWCNALSEMENLKPCYYLTAGHSDVFRSEFVDINNDCVNWIANGYRLPTEAEWEYAARGGLEGDKYPWGNEEPVCKKGQYNGAHFSTYISPLKKGECDFIITAQVGTYSPNGYGLYDMAGNAFEVCWDVWDNEYYEISPSDNPRGPLDGDAHIVRGGGVTSDAPHIQVSSRALIPTQCGFNWHGFRPVRSE